jgi:hypothetical protein
MWFARVKQLFHPFFHIFGHALNTGMLKPAPPGIFSEREIPQTVLGDGFVQVQ